MKLQDVWKKYEQDIEFNFSVLPTKIRQAGKEVHFFPQDIIVSGGDRLKYIFFIQSGTAIGQREYANGKEYTYFRVDSGGGNIGMLELLSRNEILVASVIALTKVTAIRIDAALVLEMIMNDIHFTRRALTLVAKDLYKESKATGKYYYVEGIDRIRYYLIERYEQMRMEWELCNIKNTQKKPEKLCIDAKYQDIANATGISIRTVGRCLKKLRELGEISSEKNNILLGKKEIERLLHSLKNLDME